MTDFSALKVVELRAELEKRGLPQYGLKRVLVERLVAATREEEGGPGDVDERAGDDEEDDSEAGSKSSLQTQGQGKSQSQNQESNLTILSMTRSRPRDSHPQTLSPFEILAPEIFAAILYHITSPPDLARLSCASTHLYARVAPILFRKFTYHGMQHERESLKRFWLTVLWKEELAACVEEVDLGEWGKCPRLEDWVGMPGGGDDRAEDSEESEGSEGSEEVAEEDVEEDVEEQDVGAGGDDDEPWDSQEESIATIESGGTNDNGSSNHGEENEAESEFDFGENHATEEEIQAAQEKMSQKWRRKKERAAFKALMAQPMPPYFKISKSDDEDSDFEPSDSGSDSDSLEYGTESEFELETGGYVGPTDARSRYGDIYDALRSESSMLGFPYEDVLGDFYKATWNPEKEPEDEEILCHLFPLLKNLKTMYLMPIDLEWYNFPLKNMVTKSFEEGQAKVLEKLETLYICSSLHVVFEPQINERSVVDTYADIGPKDHRQYELEIYQFRPYLLLPNLHTLALLTPTSNINGRNEPDTDLTPYTDKCAITSLTLDESELEPCDTFALLAAPKALIYLRWSQDSHCQSWGGCQAPFHDLILPALEKHKPTLKELDLDLRHEYCTRPYHVSNPETSLENLRSFYGDPTPPHLRIANKDAVLIGSLRGFAVLKTLSIDAAALCGHQRWARSPTPMVELLPPNLHTLNLRVHVNPGRQVATGFENEYWMEQVWDLLIRKDEFMSGFRVLGMRVCRKGEHWDRARWWEGDEIREGERCLRAQLERECMRVGVRFLVEDEEWGTKIPWLKEKSEVRNPGSDW
ncbi:hypothetical protein BKA61DRAFT_662720 [Leptodontidium sp. MPI-SDFR-AT-0119]|nr:hypothetical protein BKA61DRAFT_662720 [Leptodontidium sp. MPI-SDFR-AT-0119]